MAFATPILRVTAAQASAINPGLKSAILAREIEGPGREKSNQGGWQSQDDLLTWPVPEVQPLTQAIHEALGHMIRATCDVKGRQFDVRLHAWANVCRQGAYHTRHSHADSHWSGVYYVAAGQTDPTAPRAGALEFSDPRERVECAGIPQAPFGQSLSLPPVEGLITVFPGWLYHWVNPYNGPGERISISFNAFLAPKGGE